MNHTAKPHSRSGGVRGATPRSDEPHREATLQIRRGPGRHAPELGDATAILAKYPLRSTLQASPYESWHPIGRPPGRRYGTGGVTRDSLFGEAVVWSCRPKVVTVPPVYRGAAVVCA